MHTSGRRFSHHESSNLLGFLNSIPASRLKIKSGSAPEGSSGNFPIDMYPIYLYYTRFVPMKQGEIVTKEFFRKRLEIGGIDWYNSSK